MAKMEEKINDDVMDNLKNKLTEEMNKYLEIADKIETLISTVKSKQEKEIINNYIDMAQFHYDNIYDILNKSVNLINELYKIYYDKIIENTDPNIKFAPLNKLRILEKRGNLTKIITDD
jgi:ribosomal protein L16 Arg81 hydroxylase